jgi:hypothetical protein
LLAPIEISWLVVCKRVCQSRLNQCTKVHQCGVCASHVETDQDDAEWRICKRVTTRTNLVDYAGPWRKVTRVVLHAGHVRVSLWICRVCVRAWHTRSDRTCGTPVPKYVEFLPQRSVSKTVNVLQGMGRGGVRSDMPWREAREHHEKKILRSGFSMQVRSVGYGMIVRRKNVLTSVSMTDCYS